jgi:hypothetical protein
MGDGAIEDRLLHPSHPETDQLEGVHDEDAGLAATQLERSLAAF